MKANSNQPVLGKFINGRYKVVQVLSVGEFEQAYIAEDTSPLVGDRRCVLIKHLKLDGNHRRRWEICKRRFESEAEILTKLGNYHQIPQLLNYFTDNQGFYLVQELIVGEPLIAELPISKHCGKRWSEGKCVKLLDEVLGILEFIHRHGVIHSDLRPNNLMRRTCDGKLVLIDFSGAYQVHPTQVNSQVIPRNPSLASLAIPPLGYIPAEQLSGQLSPSSDIYALGMVAIQALTGLNPSHLQANPNTREIGWQQHVSVSAAMACVLNQMVSYDFKDRYQSATDVREALKSVAIKRKEQEVRKDELSDPFICESPAVLLPSIVPKDAEQLALCLHTVSPLADSSASQHSLLKGDGALASKRSPHEHPSGSRLKKQSDVPESEVSGGSKLTPLLTGMGAGMATSNALAISFGLYTLLHPTANPGLDTLAKAIEQYQAGNFDEAIALLDSIETDSSAYEEASSARQEWRQEWNAAAARFQAVEEAFNEGRWRDVLIEAHDIPNIPVWQQKIQPFVLAAKPELEAQAQQLLNEAYKLAAQKNYTGALAFLKQIPQDTAIGAKIQPKLTEYNQKQQLQAETSLQKAYQQAFKKNFKGALKYLSQIPQETPTYQKAQIKIAEYTQKQDFLEEVQRQVQLSANLPKEEVKLTNLSQRSSTSNASSKLNPGSHLKEVSPKPVLATRARR